MMTMVTGEDSAIATAVPVLQEAETGGEVPAFHAGGTPGGGPGMRGMHHVQPAQPPTPPTSQDIKQPPSHLPPPQPHQQHQMPPQSGGQMMQYAMAGAGRGNTPQAPFYSNPRAAPGAPRMTHTRAPVVLSNNSQAYMSQQVVQSVYPPPLVQTQMPNQQPVFVPHINPPFQIPQQRHQGGTMYPSPIFLSQQLPHPYPPYQQMFYAGPLQPVSRPGGSGPVPTSQGPAPPQPQPGSMAVVTGPGGPMVPPPGVAQPPKARKKNILSIIDPDSGRDIIQEMLDVTPPRSGESSTRQTPQPSTGQTPDQALVADFATRVAAAARSDQTGSPNSPALQQPSSRTSNYSESESQASPDPQGVVSPSKLDTSVESISSESQIVENNITYDANQPTTMVRGWTPMIAPTPMHVDYNAIPMHHPGMRISDVELMSGPPPNQPPSNYSTQWLPDMTMMVKESTTPMEPQPRPAQERITPVVSALDGPTVEIAPRREPFPALGKHQQQSPSKRNKRLEQNQDQMDSKTKETPQPLQPQIASQQQPTQPTAPVQLAQQQSSLPQQQQQQQQQQSIAPTQPQVQQQSQPQKAQPKSKSITPTVESKKQSTPSQDSDEYVQSLQTRNEPKTIIIKKNVSDSPETKSKTTDSLLNKENNNLETRNLNEGLVQENNNRNKSDVSKSEVAAAKENLPAALTVVVSEKIVPVESQESTASSGAELQPDVNSDCLNSKTNGETTLDDAKSSNQKSKSSSKRPSQSKMRPDKKESRSVEAEAPVTDISSSPTPPVSAPAVVINSEQPEQETQEDAVLDEKEKEKEDLMVAAKNEENNKQTASLKNETNHTQMIENVSKGFLAHKYKDDQWSPFNTSGKRKYDSDFIMSLKDDPQSKIRPKNLPDLELLRDNKQRPPDRSFMNSMMRGHGDSLMPNFANKNSSRSGGAPITKKGSNQGKPGKATKTPVLHVSLSLHQDVKLHEAENAWKPARAANVENLTAEEVKTEELYKRVRSVLNKLTPEKFNKLVQQVQNLPIDNFKRLEGVIDLVFKKAVEEPSFSVAYAQMCKTLQKMHVPSDETNDEGKPQEVNFKKLLISKCQLEFEKNTAAELKRDERLKEINAETDPEKKKLLQLGYEEEERKIRIKSVGNIRFIGELYKLQMLTSKIMHRCINHLLKEGDEESLECLCKLLTTVGHKLEAAPAESRDDPDLNGYFKQLLDDYVKNKGSGRVSSRVRFMIQDLIDLRNNKWVPRRDDSNPKTIDQIQKEAERETMEMNSVLNSPLERNKRQDSSNSLNNRRRGATDNSGWQTVPNKAKYVVESSKLKLNKSEMEVVPANVSLGNRTQFMWGQGASAGKVDENKRPMKSNTNMFAVLDDKVSQPSSRSSSLKGVSVTDRERERDRMYASSYKSNIDEDVRSSSRSGSQQGQGSRSSSRDSISSTRRDDRRFMSPVAKAPPPAPSPGRSSELSTEELGKEAKLVLEEYLTCGDLNEATLCLTEKFNQPRAINLFIETVCCVAMEKKGPGPKRSAGKLINHFIKNSNITKQQYLEGLSGVLGTVEDLAIDVPHVWEYLAEIMVDIIADEVLTFRDLADALEAVKGSAGVLKFFSHLIDILLAEKDKDMSWLEQRWILSQVSLEDFIKPEDVKSFVEQKKLDFMLDKGSVQMSTIKTILTRKIASRTSFDELTAWIDENVGHRTAEPQFVRALMTAILESTVTKNQKSYKVDRGLLSDYDRLIVKYTNHEEKYELPCLYAIQAFIHKLEHPQGVIHSLFEHLCDGELIASETFKSWRDSQDPHEREGHAVCAKSLTSFFTLLNETETDDES